MSGPEVVIQLPDGVPVSLDQLDSIMRTAVLAGVGKLTVAMGAAPAAPPTKKDSGEIWEQPPHWERPINESGT